MTEVNQYPACRSPRNSGPAAGSPARAAAHRTQATPTHGKENPTEGKATRIQAKIKKNPSEGGAITHKVEYPA